jgi:hypothetical protein
MKKIMFTLLMLITLSAGCASKNVVVQSSNTIHVSDAIYDGALKLVARMYLSGDISENQLNSVMEVAETYRRTKNYYVTVLRVVNAINNGRDVQPILQEARLRHTPALYAELSAVYDLYTFSVDKEKVFVDYLIMLGTRIETVVSNLQQAIEDLKNEAGSAEEVLQKAA